MKKKLVVFLATILCSYNSYQMAQGGEKNNAKDLLNQTFKQHNSSSLDQQISSWEQKLGQF
jgi:hypothetical protein